MIGRFLVKSSQDSTESNIYADRSALVLDWLLRIGIAKEAFSIREVAKETGVSVGLVQRVFAALVQQGFLDVEGYRTSKKFMLRKARALLNSWREHYNVVKKCKMHTYQSAFQDRDELISVLAKSKISREVALALHSAADAHGCKYTNLTTLELYLLDPAERKRVEDLLQLEPQERGYEVLLVEPYYKGLVNLSAGEPLKVSPPLLTYLDLFHFPLRGSDQAEILAQRHPELRRIRKDGSA